MLYGMVWVMTEKKWDEILRQPILANGGAEGQIIVSDPTLFKVKQRVFLISNAQQSRELIINRISTTGVLTLGKLGSHIDSFENLSDFLLIDAPQIFALRQVRSSITPNDYERAVYEEEPIMAKRTIAVDAMGNKYSTKNPLPVRLSDGSVNIGTVNADIEVALTHKATVPKPIPDSVRVGNGVNELNINPDGSINIGATSLPTGAATEAKQDNQISQAVDTNTKLNNIITNTNDIEILITSTNSLITAANTLLTNINGNTDTVEALITSSNGILTQIRDNADTLETLIGSTNTILTAVNANTDTLEALVTSTNSKLDIANAYLLSIAGYVDGIETLIAATNTKLDTLIAKNLTFANDKVDSSGSNNYLLGANGITKAAVDWTGAVKVGFNPGTIDTFGQIVTANRNNQIEVKFESGAISDLVLAENSSTGLSNILNGYATFSTGIGSSAISKGTSKNKVSYKSAQEIFCLFTAAFTPPTSANSYQRIGLYDTNNGFHIGYEGLSFSICKFNKKIRTSETPNGDPLDGSSNSKFTRNGIPEAINYSMMNVYRIRFGWLGAAPIYFEVMSPDGFWIKRHTIYQPNLSMEPSIASPSLPMRVSVVKSASDATDLKVMTSCWAAGTNYVKDVGESIRDEFTENSPLNVVQPLYNQVEMVELLKGIKNELTLMRVHLGLITGADNLTPDETKNDEEI